MGQQNTLTASLQRGKTPPASILWPSQLGLSNIPTSSLQRGKTSPTNSLVGWGVRIHRMHLCRGVTLSQRKAQLAEAVEYTDCKSAEG